MRKIVLITAALGAALALAACDADPQPQPDQVYPTDEPSQPATDRPERPNCLMQNGTACP